MRLIQVSNMRLVSFYGSDIPDYAILSHVWGEEEVSFLDIQDLDKARARKGYEKIVLSCDQAKKDGLEYVWIDTCCIDKSSSAELSESINSMFLWYQRSTICYAYLDTPPVLQNTSAGVLDLPEIFREARWFTRGWTLQELIAPRRVEFYDVNWASLGDKITERSAISERTGIPEPVLENRYNPQKCSVAQRMSWAAGRMTTRVEDAAYSLLGLLDVNMPLLYGEGEKAFIRLQEEIIKTSTDESIFAWQGSAQDMLLQRLMPRKPDMLASSPEQFATAANIVPLSLAGNSYAITNQGLEIRLPLLETPDSGLIGILNCHDDGDIFNCVGLKLRPNGTDTEGVPHFSRGNTCRVHESEVRKAVRTAIVLRSRLGKTGTPYKEFFQVRRSPEPTESSPFKVDLAFFESPYFGTYHWWKPEARLLRLERSNISTRLEQGDGPRRPYRKWQLGFVMSDPGLTLRLMVAVSIPLEERLSPQLELDQTSCDPEQSLWRTWVGKLGAPIRDDISRVESAEEYQGATSRTWGRDLLFPGKCEILVTLRREEKMGYSGWVLEVRNVHPRENVSA